jgi:uncharacterized protein YxjI
MSRENFTIDEKLYQKILNSKTVQGLAWKIEQATQKEGEVRELVKMLIEKWAELTRVRLYFPDLKNVFTPEAVFCIEYAYNQERDKSTHAYPMARVYGILADISNRVARHDTAPEQLKRIYNSLVSRWSEALEVLPLFDISEVEDARLSVNKKLFIPPTAQVTTVTKPKKKRRGKIVREVEEQLNSLEPKFSIQDGRLIIT